jgi:hypothetical protein
VLQSPLRLASASPTKSGSSKSSPNKSAPGTPSPSPRGTKASPAASTLSNEDIDDNEDGDEEVQTITLVQGSHPRVVEEAKDLVILEDVELSAEERARAATSNGTLPFT